MNRRELRGSFLLTLAALIWGCAFVAQSVGMDYVGPFTFQAVRSLIGSAVLVPVILLMRSAKKKSGQPYQMTRVQWKKQIVGGVLCGIILSVAANFQQAGIQFTTVGKAGFITAMYILIVPLLGLFFRKKVSVRIWLCVLIATAGLYLLCMSGDFSVGLGDTLVFFCAISFALHILIVDYFAAEVDGVILSCTQFLVCGLISVVLMFLFEQPTWGAIVQAWAPILYAGVLSCGVAYTLQILGQRDNTNAPVASLLMSLESVFSVLAGILVLRQIPSLRETGGILLMFAAIVLAQLPVRGKTKKDEGTQQC